MPPTHQQNIRRATEESRYYIPHRWITDKQNVIADGPFHTHETAKSVYEIMARNIDWEVHPPILAGSRGEAIAWSINKGYFHDAAAGG